MVAPPPKTPRRSSLIQLNAINNPPRPLICPPAAGNVQALGNRPQNCPKFVVGKYNVRKCV